MIEVQMVDFTTFLEPKILALIIALLVLIIIIVVLFIVQKKLKKKIVSKETIEEKESSMLLEVKNLKNSKESPESVLNKLNKLSRDFLEQEFKISKGTDYGEMIHEFNKKGKKSLSVFCGKMLEALYSGDKVQRSKVNTLLNKFDKIISELHPDMVLKKPPETAKPIETPEVHKEPDKESVEEEIKKAIQEGKAELNVKQVQPVEEKIPEKLKIKVEEKPPVIKKPTKTQKIPMLDPNKPIEESVLIIPKRPKFSMPQGKSITLGKIHELDEKQIHDAYKQLQFQFNEAYKELKRRKDKRKVMRLNEFKKILMENIQKYLNDPSKTRQLAGEISAGMKFLNALVR